MAQSFPVHEESTRFAAVRVADFPQRLRLLNAGIRDLLLDFWNDARRRRALEIVRAMSDAGPSRETSRILRSLSALLSLPFGDACAIRTPLEEKLGELLDLLEDASRRESA